jgi:hypothetical protein
MTPLWAVENTGLNIGCVAPYWRLMGDRYGDLCKSLNNAEDSMSLLLAWVSKQYSISKMRLQAHKDLRLSYVMSMQKHLSVPVGIQEC